MENEMKLIVAGNLIVTVESDEKHGFLIANKLMNNK